jgi:hypothetical protein
VYGDEHAAEAATDVDPIVLERLSGVICKKAGKRITIGDL